MNTINIDQREITIPETWNDLPTLRQVVHLFQVVTADIPSFLTAELVDRARRLEAAKVILGITDTFIDEYRSSLIEDHGKEPGMDIFIAAIEHIVRAATDWLYEPPNEEDEPGALKLRLNLTKNPYPILEYTSKRGKKKHYHGPAHELENLTLYELASAFTVFENFVTTKDAAMADQLLAILYRPAKPATPHNKRSGYEGDIRLPYRKHEAMVPNRAARMNMLPRSVKSLLLFWFASCRTSIISQYQNIFRSKDDERQGNDYAWGGMLLSLANGLADLDAVADQNFHNAFTYLSMLEDQRLEAEMWGRNS